MEQKVEEVVEILKELGEELEKTPGNEKKELALAYAIGYLESRAGLPQNENPW